MKKSVVLVSLLGCLLLGGCRQPVTLPSLAELKFELETKEVHDGDEFAFVIYSNHPKIKITSYECPIAPKMVNKDVEYDVTNGKARFSEKVNVKETGRGRIAITVEDVATGAEKSFSAVYTTIGQSNISVVLENEPINNDNGYLRYGYPVIVAGDDVVFTIYSSEEELELVEFECEFNDGTLEKGSTIRFENDGTVFKKVYRFPAVSFEKESSDFSKPSLMKFKFHDATTSEDIDVTPVEYVKVFPLEVHGVLEPTTLVDGQSATVRISSDNRKEFAITGYEGEFALKDFEDGYSRNVSGGMVKFELENLVIKSDHNGELVFYVEDSKYTGRKAEPIRLAYKAEVKAAPGSFSVNNNAFFRINEYEGSGDKDGTAEFIVTPDNEAADNRFTVTVDESSIGEVTVEPAGIISDGRFTVYGGSKGGDVTLRVESVKDPSIYTLVKGYVRHTVAVQVDGRFEDVFNKNFCPHMTIAGYVGSCFNNLYDYPLNLSSEKKAGWYGIPKELTARVVKIKKKMSNVKDIVYYREDEVSRYYDFSPVDVNSAFEVRTRVTAGNVMHEAYDYLGTYLHEKYVDASQIICAYLLLNHQHEAKSILSNQWKSGSNKVEFLEKSSSTTSVVSLDKSLDFLTKIDNCVMYRQYYDMFSEPYSIDKKINGAAAREWGSLSFEISNVDYDHDLFNLKYIIYMFKVNNANGIGDPHWWDTFDPVDWIVPYNESGYSF